MDLRRSQISECSQKDKSGVTKTMHYGGITRTMATSWLYDMNWWQANERPSAKQVPEQQQDATGHDAAHDDRVPPPPCVDHADDRIQGRHLG